MGGILFAEAVQREPLMKVIALSMEDCIQEKFLLILLAMDELYVRMGG